MDRIFHNGILVTSPEVKSYADGQLTLEQLEKQGYIEIKSDDYIAYEFQGIGMLNFSIDKIMNDDNISILCDRTNAPLYSYPRVFKRSKVMDDGMFESFLNETKVRPTKDQDLANNPYGIKRWEFAEVFDTYCVETAIGNVFLTQKQKEEFEPLIKALNEQQEAKR